MSQDSHTVHLVDDEEAIRRSVSFMLKTSGYTVKTYVSGVELLKERDLTPGCILLDVRMPEMNGIEVVQALHDRGVSYPIIIMTGHGDVNVVVQAMKLGAIEFIEKPFEKSVLLGSIEEGFARLENADRHQIRADEARVRLDALTSRERDVLEGLVRGHPNKTIGYDLDISPRTVEIHRANLMSKLRVRSLSGCLRIAFAAELGAHEDGESRERLSGPSGGKDAA